jgi:phenylalanine-4-hydroxylase
MNSELSAYEQAGREGLDPRCVPVKMDAAPPTGEAIVYPDYAEEEQETWRFLYERQMELLPRLACQEYLHGLEKLELRADRIPALSNVHHRLMETIGWGVARIPGLLTEKDFFGLLAKKLSPSTDYVRPRHEADYTPAPDMFHDVFGHAPMITDPFFAEFYQRFGEAALRAEGPLLRSLERFYWFTIEFGLINAPEGLRVYGNGILSSHREVQHCLTDAVEKRAFSPEAVIGESYDVWHMQPLLFVIDSFEDLKKSFEVWGKKEGVL